MKRLLILLLPLILLCGCSNNPKVVKLNFQIEEDLKPIETNTLKQGTYDVSIVTNTVLFEVYNAKLNIYDDVSTLYFELPKDCIHLKFNDIDYSANAALVDDDYISYEINVDSIDKVYDCLVYSFNDNVWYERQFYIDSSSLIGAYNYNFPDGEYLIDCNLVGGSGKATISSPCELKVFNGEMYVYIEWSSPHYDYMIVNDTKYYPINTSGNSLFEIKIENLNKLSCIADTTAMSKPHEVAYTIYFMEDSLEVYN